MNKENKNIKKLIAAGNLEDALDVLKHTIQLYNLGNSYEREVYILLERFSTNSRENRKGVISKQDHDLERNKLTNAVLELWEKTGKEILDTSQKLFIEGKKVLKKNNYELAIVYFTRAIEFDENNYDAYTERGSLKCIMKTPNYISAVEDFNQALEIKPNYFLTLLNRGVAYYYLNEREKACNDWINVKNQGYPHADEKPF